VIFSNLRNLRYSRSPPRLLAPTGRNRAKLPPNPPHRPSDANRLSQTAPVAHRAPRRDARIAPQATRIASEAPFCIARARRRARKAQKHANRCLISTEKPRISRSKTALFFVESSHGRSRKLLFPPSPRGKEDPPTFTRLWRAHLFDSSPPAVAVRPAGAKESICGISAESASSALLPFPASSTPRHSPLHLPFRPSIRPAGAKESICVHPRSSASKCRAVPSLRSPLLHKPSPLPPRRSP
jgi:hypothetical protein